MGSGAAFYVHGDLERRKRRQNKRKPFKKNKNYYKDDGKTFTFPKPSEAQLDIIRTKIKRQQRLDTFKLIISFVIGVPLVIAGLYYLGSIL